LLVALAAVAAVALLAAVVAQVGLEAFTGVEEQEVMPVPVEVAAQLHQAAVTFIIMVQPQLPEAVVVVEEVVSLTAKALVSITEVRAVVWVYAAKAQPAVVVVAQVLAAVEQHTAAAVVILNLQLAHPAALAQFALFGAQVVLSQVH
jgi:hypothetical protein